MLNKFKVGDRVRIFGWCAERGSDSYIHGSNFDFALVEKLFDGGFVFLQNGREYLAVDKQCRRLIKKERHRLFVYEDAFKNSLHVKTSVSAWPEPYSDEMNRNIYKVIEFVEVRKKK